MNQRLLQQTTGQWKRSLKTSFLVFLLALAGLVGLGLWASPQTGPSAQAQTPSPATSQVLPSQTGTLPPAPAPLTEMPQPPGLQATPAPPSQGQPALQDAAWPPGSDSPSQGSNFLGHLQKTLLVLALLSLLIWGILRLIAPRMAGMAGLARAPGSHRKLLNILERHSLGPGRGLMVVEVAGRHLLVGMTEHGVQTLAELDAEEVRLAQQAPLTADPAPSGTSEPSRNLLGEVLSRHLSALPGLSPRQKGPEPR